MKLVILFLLITYSGLGKCKFATYTVQKTWLSCFYPIIINQRFCKPVVSTFVYFKLFYILLYYICYLLYQCLSTRMYISIKWVMVLLKQSNQKILTL